MNKKNILFTLLLLVLIAGCSNIDLSKVSDEDLKRISETAIVCNKPYMRLGAECCLDKDGNGICDKDEGEAAPREERSEEDNVEPIIQGDKLICNKPYIQVGTECCLDKDSNSICDYDDEYYAEEEVVEEEEVPEEEFNEESEEESEEETTSDEPDYDPAACNYDDLIGFECTSALQGDCQSGTYQCINGRIGCKGADREEEACDNRDNDCDGRVDNGNPEGGDECTTSTGKDGETQCRNGMIFCAQVGAETDADCTEELCNGIDDDCDGETDEDFGLKGYSCSKGYGICQRTGTYVCDPDQTDVMCGAEDVEPQDEVCNGQDDDCNGGIDDGDPEGGDDCTIGGNPGVESCRSGSIQCVVRSTEESCNGIDDDQDGAVDEDLNGGSCSRSGGFMGWYTKYGTYQCQGGTWYCVT